MALYGSKRDIDDHRPYISYTQKYTYEKGGADDETEEKYTGEVKYDPDCTIHPYHIVEVLEEFGFFWKLWSDYLCHDFTLAYFPARVKDFYVFLSRSVIEYPDRVTLADAELVEFFLIHVFSVMDAGRELIEEFHDVFLPQTQIFTSPDIIICTLFVALFQGASSQCMGYFSGGTEPVCVVLGYTIEYL